ncbi:MAG: DoxX family protein [Candidatus Tectomicrobia bacterium]|uniref:DoxX family protein n=1 Tax=Tectimicrobiota bacterium TaxID=2528274 RepID=A0A932MNB4_UNCTE|nr:DoxX family protein [Candidatus Tectomicrobia bacterium]
MRNATDRIAQSLHPYALAASRIVLGSVFLYHGWGKVMNFAATIGFFSQVGILLPGPSAAAAALAEVAGGLALILGIGVSFAALPLAFTVAMAILFVHLGAGFAAPNGYEFPLVLLAAVLAQGTAGAGAYALGGLLEARGRGGAGALRRQAA